MRALVLTDGKWLESCPSDLARWVWEHRGEDAVVVDDGPPKVFYCNRLTTIAKYLDSGKDARPFAELLRTVPAAEVDPTTLPGYCADGAERSGWLGWAVCGQREECGGRRRYCGG